MGSNYDVVEIMSLDGVLGVDLGTSSLKIASANAEGEILGRASRPISSRAHPGGWLEQDPLSWFDALRLAVNDLASAAALPRGRWGIAIGAHVGSVVLAPSVEAPLADEVRCAMWLGHREPEGWVGTGLHERLSEMDRAYPDHVGWEAVTWLGLVLTGQTLVPTNVVTYAWPSLGSDSGLARSLSQARPILPGHWVDVRPHPALPVLPQEFAELTLLGNDGLLAAIGGHLHSSCLVIEVAGTARTLWDMRTVRSQGTRKSLAGRSPLPYFWIGATLSSTPTSDLSAMAESANRVHAQTFPHPDFEPSFAIVGGQAEAEEYVDVRRAWARDNGWTLRVSDGAFVGAVTACLLGLEARAEDRRG